MSYTNTRALIAAQLSNQWQASPDLYSRTHAWPLYSYGSLTPYGMVPFNQPRAFTGPQQANMLAQAQRGGNVMSFGMMAPVREMQQWGDLGERYAVRYW